MKAVLLSAALAFVLRIMDCHGQGTHVARHFGSADPTTEGFVLCKAGNPLLTPASGVASLWIDGSEAIESLPRYADRNPSQLAWGCNQLPRIPALILKPNQVRDPEHSGFLSLSVPTGQLHIRPGQSPGSTRAIVSAGQQPAS